MSAPGITYHQRTPIGYPRMARPQLIKRYPLRRRFSFPPLFRLFRFALLPFCSSHTNLTKVLRETRRTSLTMLNFPLVQTTNQSACVRYGSEKILCPGGREEECETMKGLGRGGRRGMGGTLEEDKGDTVIGGCRMQTSTGYPKLYRPKKNQIMQSFLLKQSTYSVSASVQLIFCVSNLCCKLTSSWAP